MTIVPFKIVNNYCLFLGFTVIVPFTIVKKMFSNTKKDKFGSIYSCKITSSFLGGSLCTTEI